MLGQFCVLVPVIDQGWMAYMQLHSTCAICTRHGSAWHTAGKRNPIPLTTPQLIHVTYKSVVFTERFEQREAAEEGLTVRVTAPVGAGPLLGVVATPAMETGVPAGAVPGFGVAVRIGTYGCAHVHTMRSGTQGEYEEAFCTPSLGCMQECGKYESKSNIPAAMAMSFGERRGQAWCSGLPPAIPSRVSWHGRDVGIDTHHTSI